MKAGTLYSVLTILLFSVPLAEADAAGVYKWVDAEGNVHYGEQPPPEGAKEIHIRSGGNNNLDDEPIPSRQQADPKAQRDKMIQALQGDRQARQEQKQKHKKQQQQQKMQCAQAKDTLRQYKSAGSLYKLDAQGNRHTMPDSAKQQQIQRLQADIKKRCK